MRKLSGILLVAFAISAGFFGLRRVAADSVAPSFSATAFTTGQVAPAVLAVSDFNRDGAPDVAVTTNAGIAEFKGQFSSGKPTGGLGNVQTSSLNSCGTPQNLAIGTNWQRPNEAPVLYGTVTNANNMFYVVSSSGFPNTSATCATTSTPGGNYNWLAIGDFDTDGMADSVMVKNTGFIYLAHGAFSGPGLPTYDVSVALPNALANATTVTAGDFNGDGRPDVFAASGSNVVFFPAAGVAINAGLANVFSSANATTVSVGGSAPITRILITDATGDGKPDVIATTSTGVVVFPGDGTGVVGSQTGVTIPATYSANATAVGDFNGDGFPDLMVAATASGGAANNVLLFYPGTGGAFGTVQSIQIGIDALADLDPRDVVATDMDGDGRLDLVVATRNDNNVWVLINGGNRLITTSANSLQFHAVIGQASPAPAVVKVGTSNSAPTPSLTVAASPLVPALSWVSQSATGDQVTIAPDISTAPGTGVFRGIAAVSAPGYMQVLIPYTVTITQQTGTVIRGGQSGTAATGIAGPGGSSGPKADIMAVADFNGDGIPDIASLFNTGCSSSYAGVYLRSSDGTGYTTPACAQGAYAFNNGATAVVAADFNLDGNQDAVFVSGNGTVLVTDGEGTGKLAQAGWYPITLGANGASVADLNSDGAPDLVVTAAQGSGNGGITILLNNGAGAFSVNTIRNGHHYYSPVIEDFNGDGIPDIAARNQSSNAEWALEVLLGQGGGQFGAPQPVSFFIPDCSGTTAQCTRPVYQSSFNSPSLAMVAGDFNGDGYPDLAFVDKPEFTTPAQPLQPAIVVALASVDASHNVTFNLTSQGPILQNQSTPPYYISTGDLDGDGKLDLVFNRTGSGGGIVIQFGVGNGTFGDEKVLGYSFVGNTSATLLTDLDGDGRLDIIGPVVAGDFGGTATAFFMGAKVATTLAFNGLPVSAASLSSENIDFRGAITLVPPVQYPVHWVRDTTVPISFYDVYPIVAGTGVPTLTAANTLVGTYSGPVGIGTHAFEARFPGDNRMLAPTSTPVYAPGLAFSTQPSSAGIGVAMSPDPVVRVTVPGGSNTDFSFNGPVSIGIDHGSFSSGVVTTVNAVNGVATFTGVKLAQSGNFYLTAMAGSTLVNSGTFDVTGGAQPASLTVIAGSPQSATVNTVFATAFQVKLTDTSNSPISGQTITFTAPISGPTGDFSGSATATAVTDASGIATAPSFTAATEAGTYQVAASALSLNTSLTLTNTPAAATLMTIVSGDSQSAPLAVTFTTAMAVKITDAYLNPINGAPVTFTAPGSGASGTFATTSTVNTNSGGIAAAPAFTANNTTGIYQVTATSGALSQTFHLSNLNGAPAHMTIVAGNGQSATVGTAFATPLSVKITDASDNPLLNVGVSFIRPLSGAGGTFAGSSTVFTDASGIATAPVFTANATAGSYTVGASAVTLGASFSLTNVAGPPAMMTPSGTPQTGGISQAYPIALSVRIADASNNPIAGQSVVFTAPATGASGHFSGSGATATVVTGANGVATAPPFTANSTAGAFIVTAASGSFTATFNLTNTVLPVAGVEAYSGAGQGTQPNAVFSSPLTARVYNSNGEPVANATVTFTLPSSGASATFSGSALTFTTTTNSAGLAVSPVLTANSIVGSYNATATTGVFSATFTLANSTPAPLTVSPNLVTFRYELGGALPAAQTVRVSGANGPFGFTADVPWVKVAIKSPDVTVSVDPASLKAGYYYGNITLGGNAVLRVALQVATPPQIVPNTTSLTFRYKVGDSAPPEQMLYVTAYTRNFDFTATSSQTGPANPAWLHIGGTGAGTTPAALHVSVAPQGLAAGAYEGAIHIVASDATNSPMDIKVTLVVTDSTAPEMSAVVNAASSQNGPVAPNEIATLYGQNLSCASGPQVLVNDAPAQVLATTDTQINFVLPDLAQATQAAIQFRCGSVTAGPLSLAVAAQFPGIFVSGGSQVAAYNEGFVLNGSGTPAARGTVVMLFGTGFGALSAPDESGLQWLASAPTVTIGGINAEILFAGGAPGLPGVTQLNVRIPADASAGSAPVIATIGGVTAQSNLTVAVN